MVEHKDPKLIESKRVSGSVDISTRGTSARSALFEARRPTMDDVDNGQHCDELSNQDNANGWKYKLTQTDKAVLKAERQVAASVRSLAGPKVSKPALEVNFELIEDDKDFKNISLLDIYASIRKISPSAQARVTVKGNLQVTVNNMQDFTAVQTLTHIVELPVKRVEERWQMWGRITNVNPQFSEKDLLKELSSQDVVEVKREMYSVRGTDKDGKEIKVQRNSNRLRVRFGNDPRGELTILGEFFRVTICVDSPTQCLTCLRFNHRSDTCPRRGEALCRRCGKKGHQQWQCTAKAKCVNCQGDHSSSDPRCHVYATWATAAKTRYLSKVVTNTPNIELHVENPQVHERSSSENTQTTGKSFAAALKLVKKNPDGAQDTVFRIPSNDPKKIMNKPTSKKQEPKKPTSGSSHDVSGLVTVVKQLWELAKPLLQPWLDKNPEIAKVIDLFESNELANNLLLGLLKVSSTTKN